MTGRGSRVFSCHCEGRSPEAIPEIAFPPRGPHKIRDFVGLCFARNDIYELVNNLKGPFLTLA